MPTKGINMKRPKIIMHNQISLDGSLTNFPVNMELHYQLLGTFNADAHLIGSNTAKTGLDHFLEKIPKETPKDQLPTTPNPQDPRPYWILIDSHAQMHNLLHIFRQYDYCKDLILLLTPNTPQTYQTYLKKRKYNIITTGNNHINLKESLEKLHTIYNINTIVTDTGPTLNSILLQHKLLDEISLIIAPNIVGKKQLNLFNKLLQNSNQFTLKLFIKKTYDNYLHLQFRIQYQ
jgi:2,5-diamino-6-(ribosylamino)-4(3H)-pyrimidinone 5'-phosphate reductase